MHDQGQGVCEYAFYGAAYGKQRKYAVQNAQCRGLWNRCRSHRGEVDVSGIVFGEDLFTTVGLPDTAVRESRDRVRPALKN